MIRTALVTCLALAALPPAVQAETFTRRSASGAVTGTVTEQPHVFSNGNRSFVERGPTGAVERTYTQNGSQNSFTVRGPNGENLGTTSGLRITPMSREGVGR